MATRTLTGSRPVTNSPYLELDVTDSSQEVANNRTRVNLKLYLRVTHPISYRAIYTGKLQGSSFTANRTINSPGRYLLHETNIWVVHTSDGTKTQNFSGSYNIQITWSGKWISSLSVSGNVTLPRIPRTSTLSSASISSLSANSSATLSIGRTVHSSSFYHLVTILDGSTWVWDPGYVSGSPPTSITIPSSIVNKMLNSMSNVTSKTFRVRLRTYTGSGGSGYIGESIRNVTVSVNSSVVPSASGMSVSINGSGHDKTINKYVQGISRVTASFNSGAGYGASIASQSIVVRRSSDSADSQTISGRSGTTNREVRTNGTYEAIGTVRDSRGRTATSRITFTVEAYSPPNIGSTSVERVSGNERAATVSYTSNWSRLGGSNLATLVIERKLSTSTDGLAAIIRTIANNSSGTITGSMTDTITASSFDYTFILTDQFGRRDTVVQSLGTPRVLLSLNKDIGIGIGKYHEDGVLDVDGPAFFKGPVHMSHIVTSPEGHDTDFNLLNRTAFYHVGSSALNGPPSKRWGFLYVNADARNDNTEVNQVSQIFHERDGNQDVWTRVMTNGTWRDWKKLAHGTSGSSSNGDWIRFDDGTQICWRWSTAVYTSSTRFLERYWAPPVAFVDKPIAIASRDTYWGGWAHTTSVPSANITSDGRVHVRVWSQQNSAWTTDAVIDIVLFVIGRWK